MTNQRFLISNQWIDTLLCNTNNMKEKFERKSTKKKGDKERKIEK